MIFDNEIEKDETEHGKSRIFTYITAVTILILISIVVVAIFGQIVYKNDLAHGSYEYFNEGWIWEKSDGTKEEIAFPCHLNTALSESVTVSSTMPDDIKDGMFMYILVGRNIKVFIDGECRFVNDQSDMRLPGKIVKSVYFPIQLSAADAGKPIRFIKQESGAKNGNFNEIMYGDLSAMNHHILVTYGPIGVLAAILCLISIAIIITGFVIMLRSNTVFPIKTMSVGVLLLSLWAICDSMAYQFIFGNYFVDGVVSYMIMCIATIPFLKYLNIIQDRRYEKMYAVLCIIQLVMTFVIYILHFADIKSFEQTRPYVNLMIAISCVAVIIAIINDMFRKRTEEYKYVVWGLVALAICGCVEMLYINVFHELTNGIYIIIGLYILVFGAFAHSVNVVNAIEQEKQAAYQASIMKSTFLANMSHEIRTPINSIMGMNEMILRESEEDDIIGYAEHIDRSSRLLLGILTDILDFSKIEAGKVDSREEEYDVASMLQDMASLMEAHAAQRNLQAVVTVSETIPAKMTGDRIHILQVIINLISNAAKYTEEGSITLSAYSTEVIDNKCKLCFRVSDTGIGMRKEDLKHIFDSFTRFDEKKNRNIQGTGLGMAITKKLIDAMEGQINIDSEYGRGTSIVVELPQEVVSDEVIGTKWRTVVDKKRVRGYRERFKAPSASVLAIDDNDTNLLIIKQYLKRTDVEIDMCNNGKEALEKCSKKKYDLILLDHMMPVMDGIETIEAIKSDDSNDNSKIPIIALTANAISGSREFYISKGFDDYITKPIEAEIFEETVMKYLPKDKVIII